jgi:hypothetical protein
MEREVGKRLLEAGLDRAGAVVPAVAEGVQERRLELRGLVLVRARLQRGGEARADPRVGFRVAAEEQERGEGALVRGRR